MLLLLLFFFFNDTSTTEIYTLSLHDALPISIGKGVTECDEDVCSQGSRGGSPENGRELVRRGRHKRRAGAAGHERSEEHTSELQSHSDLVCRLLLEKKKRKDKERQ